jgi:divalent metal cation (Fe/Co/Zn/Cd) transporter
MLDSFGNDVDAHTKQLDALSLDDLIALVGFGIDSCIEVTSGTALLWSLGADVDERRRERAEAVSLRIVGVCFLALAAYVAYDAVATLVGHEAPERSIPGIALAAASLVVMPLLSRAKRRVAAEIASGAMRADAKQTELCTYLSAILLGGLLLNATIGWWWADGRARDGPDHRQGRDQGSARRGVRVLGDCHSG